MQRVYEADIAVAAQPENIGHLLADQVVNNDASAVARDFGAARGIHLLLLNPASRRSPSRPWSTSLFPRAHSGRRPRATWIPAPRRAPRAFPSGPAPRGWLQCRRS